MKKLCLVIIPMLCIISAQADDISDENPAARQNELREKIAEVDAEIAKCKKAQKGWKIATVIGAVGTVGTGSLAIFQQNRINTNKAIVNENRKVLTEVQKIHDTDKKEFEEDKKQFEEEKKLYNEITK